MISFGRARFPQLPTWPRRVASNARRESELSVILQRSRAVWDAACTSFRPIATTSLIEMADLTGLHPLKVRDAASLELIRAVVALRNIKSDEEIAELDRAAAIGYEMHTTAMRMAVQPGMTEAAIAGALDGIASARGSMVSFPSIVSMHGEVLHGFPSTATLDPTRLLLVDAGGETREHYCSDHTRTTPISGRFTQRQRDVYDIVVDCHDLALKVARPGVKYMDVHLAVCRLMTERLQALGLMKGDVDASVAAGAHALFLPHGLGHAMGMDVHDMEALGQVNVGYDEETRPLRSVWFGQLALWPPLGSGTCGDRRAGHLLHPRPDRPLARRGHEPRLLEFRRHRGL